jgi:hypothetical protein
MFRRLIPVIYRGNTVVSNIRCLKGVHAVAHRVTVRLKLDREASPRCAIELLPRLGQLRTSVSR